MSWPPRNPTARLGRTPLVLGANERRWDERELDRDGCRKQGASTGSAARRCRSDRPGRGGLWRGLEIRRHEGLTDHDGVDDRARGGAGHDCGAGCNVGVHDDGQAGRGLLHHGGASRRAGDDHGQAGSGLLHYGSASRRVGDHRRTDGTDTGTDGTDAGPDNRGTNGTDAGAHDRRAHDRGAHDRGADADDGTRLRWRRLLIEWRHR
jgi:hypothetical protein